MKKELVDVKNEIVRAIRQLSNDNWHTVKIVLAFPPYINKGWTGTQSFTDENGQKLRLAVFGDDQFNKIMYRFIAHLKVTGNENQIIFDATRGTLENANISVGYNQEIEDTFLNNLPKSQRGKTIPWWKNPEEMKDIQ
ncbi:MAG: hypothetical protein DI535_00160 [Citrobacter freundii]|nr:MAG: hypothetical protein DI535_00160 [Citrobacter freundii]